MTEEILKAEGETPGIELADMGGEQTPGEGRSKDLEGSQKKRKSAEDDSEIKQAVGQKYRMAY
jgi:hypothetical protein